MGPILNHLLRWFRKSYPHQLHPQVEKTWGIGWQRDRRESALRNDLPRENVRYGLDQSPPGRGEGKGTA